MQTTRIQRAARIHHLLFSGIPFVQCLTCPSHAVFAARTRVLLSNCFKSLAPNTNVSNETCYFGYVFSSLPLSITVVTLEKTVLLHFSSALTYVTFLISLSLTYLTFLASLFRRTSFDGCSPHTHIFYVVLRCFPLFHPKLSFFRPVSNTSTSIK
jgi:hypothetical protein